MSFASAIAASNRTALDAARETVYVQAKTETKDGAGRVTESWADVSGTPGPTAKASVMPLPGSEIIRADSLAVAQRVRVRMDYRADLAAAGASKTHRLRTGGTSGAPTGVLDIASVSVLGRAAGPTSGVLDIVATRGAA